MSGRTDDEAGLDRAFAALADPARRAIVARLSRGPASVGELAAPFDMTLQAVSKHIAVLEAAGLVSRSRDAQRRPVHLEAAAPVAAVFRAHTDPERVRQWLGPRGYEMTIGDWQATDGGRWSYVHTDGEADYAFRGTFHTVRENELLVQTFEFLGVPDVVSVESVRFEDLGGRTRLVGHSVYP